MRNILSKLLFRSICFLAMIAIFALPSFAGVKSEYGTNRAPVQTFYVPIPEENAFASLTSIWGAYKPSSGKSMFGAPESPMESRINISVFLDGTVIYYDQWEDGYERDIANPNHLYSALEPFGTQIWGDGDPSNGFPPDIPADTLWAGDVISLKSTVDLKRIGKVAYYDGCDKFASTKPIAATRTVWASESKTLFAGANEMYDTTYFGDEFVCPIGEDIASSDQNEIFEYVGLSIMAGEEGATIELYSKNGTRKNFKDGAFRKVLVEGEPLLVDGGVKLGDKIVAVNGSVQVELITGDVFDGYESRFVKLLPFRLWANSYTCPVAVPLKIGSSDCGSKIWIYNPGTTSISVACKSTSGTKNITVPPGSYAFVIPAPNQSSYSGFGKTPSGSSSSVTYTGALSGTVISSDSKFYSICTIDCLGKTASTPKASGANRTWDWGFTLIPETSLSSQVVVGLGLGRDPTSTVNPNENGAPVWVTAPAIADGKASTTLFVNYRNKGVTETHVLKPLEIIKLFDIKDKNHNDEDQTGMRIWTEDGTKLAAAWGADPQKTTSGQPGLDMGTGIPPMPEIFMQKSAVLVDDPDGDSFTRGDTIEYTIEVMNVGHVLINDITLKDILPEVVDYIPGSFSVKLMEGAQTSSPKIIDDSFFAEVVSEDGLKVTDYPTEACCGEGILRANQSWIYTYRVTIGAEARDLIKNTAIIDSSMVSLTNSVVSRLRARIGDTVWFDEDRDGIQDEDEAPLPYAIVKLVYAVTGEQVYDDFDRPYRVETGADGKYLFKGVYPGEYKVVVTVPEVYEATLANATDDSLDSDVLPAQGQYETDIFSVAGGDYKLDLDAGFVIKNDCSSISLVKTAGNAPDGEVFACQPNDEVTYSYKITNTGSTYLKNISVVDDKLEGWTGLVNGVIAPGQSVVITTKTVIPADVTNIGTVTATPTDSKGHNLLGVTETVEDSDDAIVDVDEPEIIYGSIGAYVWNDIDGNGIQDENEMGIQGILVSLVNSDGVTIATTTTDYTGKYLFSEVETGSYKVVFNPGTWSVTKLHEGGDSDKDNDALENGSTVVFELAAGENKLDVDCGLLKGVPPGICDLTAITDKFNAFVGGNLLATGGDSEGNLIVMGDADVYPGYSVGLIGPGYGRTRTAAALGTDAFVVAGNLKEGAQPDINGNIVYGGTYTNLTSMKYDARNYELRYVENVTLDRNWNVPEDASGRSLSSVKVDLDTFSAAVAALEEKGEPVYGGDQWNKIWTANDSFRNIFVVTNEIFEFAYGDIAINVPQGAKVVVNILANEFSLKDAAIRLNGTDPSKVLFNFPNATKIDIVRCNIEGSLFAPKADLSMNGAAVNGFAYVGGNVTKVIGSEFHDFAFRAFDCSSYFAQRPVLKLTLLAGEATDGAIYKALNGEDIEIRQVIENSGNFSMNGVTAIDIFGRRLAIGDLAPNTAVTNTFIVTPADNGLISYQASVSGASFDEATGAFAGATISSQDVVLLFVYESKEAKAEAVADEYAENIRTRNLYAPRPDFEVLNVEFVEPSTTDPSGYVVTAAPTLKNEAFNLRVTVKNSGEIGAVLGKIGAYVDCPGFIQDVVAPTKSIVHNRKIDAGHMETFVITGLVTPDKGGACHIRVKADADEVVSELSEGNNQFPVFAWLSPITLETSASNGAVYLTWDCFDGQTYTILVTSSLVEAFYGFDGLVEVLDEDGTVVSETDGLAIPADASGKIRVRIPLEEDDTAGFFKLRVNILDDPTEIL